MVKSRNVHLKTHIYENDKKYLLMTKARFDSVEVNSIATIISKETKKVVQNLFVGEATDFTNAFPRDNRDIDDIIASYDNQGTLVVPINEITMRDELDSHIFTMADHYATNVEKLNEKLKPNSKLSGIVPNDFQATRKGYIETKYLYNPLDSADTANIHWK